MLLSFVLEIFFQKNARLFYFFFQFLATDVSLTITRNEIFSFIQTEYNNDIVPKLKTLKNHQFYPTYNFTAIKRSILRKFVHVSLAIQKRKLIFNNSCFLFDSNAMDEICYEHKQNSNHVWNLIL